MSTPVTASTDAVTARSSGWFALVMLVVSLNVAAVVAFIGRLDDPPRPFNDPAVCNLTVFFSCCGAAFSAWFWFCFRSRFSRRLRLGVAGVTSLIVVAAVSTTVAMFAQGALVFSGSLVPRLAAREHEAALVVTTPPMEQNKLGITTAEDFPQFLGPDRNAWIRGPKLARDWDANPPRLLWKQPIGAGWSAFSAVNGFAVTLEQRGSEEWIACYEVETGKPVWGQSIPSRHETALGGIGPRSTPTIADGHVYSLGANGVLQCLSGDGQLLWSDDLRKRYSISASEDEQNVMFGRPASPLIVDSLVVVPGGGHPGKGKNLIAFDRATGLLVWECENTLPSGEADQIAYASPSLATLAGRRQILIVNETTCTAHDPATGERLWSHPWPGKSNGSASASQAVAIGDKQVLLTKGYGGGAELLELSSGNGSELTVTSVWKNPRVLQTKFSNVVVHDGHAFGLSEGILECVDLEDGSRRWKKGRFGHGQILGVGDLLLVLSEDGDLHLVALNHDKFVELGKAGALSGKTWNNLCLYGHKLLVRNAAEAACFELP
ncbi:outer membrane protein assembly factor BamB family protein [Anatilimnocola floriformis]|uniref:outer membrane protein assembly factor BamB family protein n=1 Tax=Anatilimnocola floriformis TaxID=2948575 RepID=UPI0020C4961A|nr:PQQ-binding-like beta-propeller repeat protein [Anatilimnocola floriformis]